MWQSIRRLLSEQLGDADAVAPIPMGGGENHQTWHLRYGEHDIFVKSDTHDRLPIFVSEADQLALLARTQTVRVPAVLGYGSNRDSSFLLLEFLPAKPLDTHSAFQLGQQLARLHQWSEQPHFGLDFDNALSATPQPNLWQRRWSRFFAEQRIGWQLELAAEKGIRLGETDRLVDAVQQRLMAHHPQPSLLHGDLWEGNCARGPNGPYIFNPACYWGDRECDLAMLPLHPELPTQIYDGYQSVSPLPDGFLDRQPVYQLYRLINRAVVFGGPHIPAARHALEQVLLQKI